VRKIQPSRKTCRQIFTLDQEIRQIQGKRAKFGAVDVSSFLGLFGVNFDKTNKQPRKILWRICPMRELLKRRNFETRLRNSTEPSSAEICRAVQSLALLSDSRNSKEGSRDLCDITRNNTERCLLPRVRSRVYRRD
jgi:hypothetical protein